MNKIGLKGKKHWHWRGGKKNNNGYIMIYKPKHPYRDQQGYVREHRLIMEKYLKRYLTKNEIVHHLNGIKNDNELKNLVLLTKKDHDVLHSLGKNNNFYGMKHTKDTINKLRIIALKRTITRDKLGRIKTWV